METLVKEKIFENNFDEAYKMIEKLDSNSKFDIIVSNLCRMI